MKAMTIQQVIESENDMPVISFKGTVKSVWQRRTGQKDGKPWAFQDITLTADGKELKATLVNRDLMEESMKSKVISLISCKGDHGWSGVKTKDNTYNGKTTRLLWVTGSAEIVEVEPVSDNDGGIDGEDPFAEEQDDIPFDAPAPKAAPKPAPKGKIVPKPQPQEQQDEEQDEEQDPVSPSAPVLAARKFLARAAVGMILCNRAARYVQVETEKDGEQMTEDQFQAIQSSFFIALSRNEALMSQLPSSL